MSMNEVIRQKRKELNYTQEEIAEFLGVSIPAVSKWESGASCPDVELLPALARLLKTDVNTLLCFKMELTENEIQHFMLKITELSDKEGIEKAFEFAEQVIRQYPHDVRMLHSFAAMLQGMLMLSEADEKQYEIWDRKIQQMHEQVGRSGSSEYAARANYMLAARAVQDGEYERAQELINRLPESGEIDKQLLQANLWTKTGREDDAANLYAAKVLSGYNTIQISLIKLIRRAVEEGETENAQQLVRCGKEITRALGMWRYNAESFAFEKSMAQKNGSEALKDIDSLLREMLNPWDMSECPVSRWLNSKRTESDMGKKIFPKVLNSLESCDEYEFLRKENGFEELIERYKSFNA